MSTESGFNDTRVEDRKLLILIQTAIDHLNIRHRIRQTWKRECESTPFCTSIFVAGRSNSSIVNKMLKAEALKSQDIVQVDVAESYRNLTLKTMFSIK